MTERIKEYVIQSPFSLLFILSSPFFPLNDVAADVPDDHQEMQEEERESVNSPRESKRME